jgi:hypothetical protein
MMICRAVWASMFFCNAKGTYMDMIEVPGLLLTPADVQDDAFAAGVQAEGAVGRLFHRLGWWP